MARGKKTGGRQPGTPNRVTSALKDAILNAFDRVGGQAYLVRVAKEDPRTFCMLLARVLPMQVATEGDGHVTLQVITGLPVNVNQLGD